MKYNTAVEKKARVFAGYNMPSSQDIATKAIWDGKKFAYRRRKFGSTYTERIKHYEDDDEQGYDVFVPIEEL